MNSEWKNYIMNKSYVHDIIWTAIILAPNVVSVLPTVQSTAIV